MRHSPTWAELRDRWPNAAASRFLEAGGLRWHVQLLGDGPPIVLLHGSGAASHSWGDVAPLLAKRFTVVVPDLPGHGFTDRLPSQRMSVRSIAGAVQSLLNTLRIDPVAIAGHSAGGAVALAVAAGKPPKAVIGVNAALTLPNALTSLLTPVVQAIADYPIVGSLTARLADSDRLFESLMGSTGSRVTPTQFALYQTFARSPEHAGAVMAMFANWHLEELMPLLPKISAAVTLIVSDNDGWIPPRDADRIARLLPRARVVHLAGAGHVAHEELPARVAGIIEEAAESAHE